MNIKVKTIEDVVNYQLCTGCGACASVEPARYEMTDIENFGRRPGLKNNGAETTGEAFDVCPGHALSHTFDQSNPDLDRDLMPGWGPVYEVWEGYAADEEIRFRGSSGGAATALALYAVESGKAEGVLHVGKDESRPHLNKTVYSQSRQELVSRTGSRYAPASPCDNLQEIAGRDGSSVFIGKPCDVAALHNVEKINKHLSSKVAIKIGFFCAGVPSTFGNKTLIRQQELAVEELTDLKFRGEGWPGMWRATTSNQEGGKQAKELTYADSWGFLQKYRQWRCYICPDHTGEFADIAVGDPWYREVQPGEHGKSLLVARTPRGLKFLHDAAQAGYIVLESKDSSLLPRSQRNLIKTRGGLWGRLVALRLMGAATPRFTGLQTFPFWWSELNIKAKLQSIIGTAKRVRTKNLGKNQNLI